MFGPLDRTTFIEMMEASDRLCTDVEVKTPTGASYSLVDFYEKKRKLLKKVLSPLNVIDTRDVDGLYDRIYHFLVSPNGAAETIDDYINHPTRHGTGNWGRILRNAFLEVGGTLGVMIQLNDAMIRRYIG